MRGSMTPLLKANEKVIGEMYEILKAWNLDEAPIGIDLLTVSMMEALVKFGMDVRDRQATMQEAQKIKTHEEIQLLEISAAMVDGAYYDVVEAIKPGIRENEVAAVMRKRLLEMGAENVHNVNCDLGDRAFPHPMTFQTGLSARRSGIPRYRKRLQRIQDMLLPDVLLRLSDGEAEEDL